MAERTPAAIARHFRTNVLSWLHLMRVHARILDVEQALLANHGLTRAQFDVLSHLAAEPGLSQQTLARRLLVTKGNVVGLIDRLEACKLVERRADPADRRTNRLYLTPAGEQAFAASAPPLEAEMNRQFEGLEPDEQVTLRRLLAKLDRSLRNLE